MPLKWIIGEKSQNNGMKSQLIIPPILPQVNFQPLPQQIQHELSLHLTIIYIMEILQYLLRNGIIWTSHLKIYHLTSHLWWTTSRVSKKVSIRTTYQGHCILLHTTLHCPIPAMEWSTQLMQLMSDISTQTDLSLNVDGYVGIKSVFLSKLAIPPMKRQRKVERLLFSQSPSASDHKEEKYKAWSNTWTTHWSIWTGDSSFGIQFVIMD